METITIPSPSAFLRSPVLQPTPVPKSSGPKNATKRQSRTHQSSTSKTDGTTKPKQSKSRNGCVTCKAKRLKCDETHPSCHQCHKRNVNCGGYKKDFKWRAFEETTFTTKPVPSPRIRKVSASTKGAKLYPGSPTPSDASGSTVDNGIPFSQPNYPVLLQPTIPIDPQLPRQSFSGAINTFPSNPTREIYETKEYGNPTQSFMDSLQPNSTPSTVNSIFDDGAHLQSSITTASSFSSGQSPRLIDLLLPGTDLNAPPPDYMDYQPQQSIVPYQPGGFPALQDFGVQDNDVEEIVRQQDQAEAWVMRLPSPSPSNSSSSSEGSRFESFSSIYRQPVVLPASPEMLMLRFDRQTCGILSVKDGPTENPWRTMIWPLARDSPALYHAISSMTAFHTSKTDPGMRVEGMEHMRQSIRYLVNGIANMRVDTALATTLVLAFSESWDQHISTGIEHLRGAKILVKQALSKHRQNAVSGEDFDRLKFLCNTWVYMDVIARLTSVDHDESNDFDVVFNSPLGSFSLNHEVDPLMGCASTLFPLVGRVANLVRKVARLDTNSMNIISQANDLKAAIESWEPPAFFDAPEDPTSDIQHSLQTAEAYRWATLLYLHQAVPEIPSRTAAELGKKVLIYLATVPLSSRAIIVQIYPLLAAGCEAIDHEDRTWVKDRWATMAQRMLIGNIDRCWEVVKEVWDRRDSDEADKRKQKLRRANSLMSSGFTSPYERMKGMKREFSANDLDTVPFFDWPEDPVGSKRRAIQANLGMALPAKVERSRKQSADMLEEMEFDRTVRGRLHWVGVMKDWNWEVLLG